MGQKVSPTGFRLGVTEDWRSRWFAGKDYKSNLANDLAIREFLDKELARAAVSRVEIERAGDKTKVIVTTARPGVVIGKKGSEIDALRKKLQKIATGTVSVEVIEVKRPELDAVLVPCAAFDGDGNPQEFCCISVNGLWKLHWRRRGKWKRIRTGLPEDATECGPTAES